MNGIDSSIIFETNNIIPIKQITQIPNTNQYFLCYENGIIDNFIMFDGPLTRIDEMLNLNKKENDPKFLSLAIDPSNNTSIFIAFIAKFTSLEDEDYYGYHLCIDKFHWDDEFGFLWNNRIFTSYIQDELPEISCVLCFDMKDYFLYSSISDIFKKDESYSQDIKSIFGKIIRFDIKDDTVEIPEDNPVWNLVGKNMILHKGIRKPNNLYFDKYNNLWITNVGENEVNSIYFSEYGGKKQNFGWKIFDSDKIINQELYDFSKEDEKFTKPSFTLKKFGNIYGGFLYENDQKLLILKNKFIYGNDDGNLHYYAIEKNVLNQIESDIFFSLSKIEKDFQINNLCCDNDGNIFLSYNLINSQKIIILKPYKLITRDEDFLLMDEKLEIKEEIQMKEYEYMSNDEMKEIALRCIKENNLKKSNLRVIIKTERINDEWIENLTIPHPRITIALYNGKDYHMKNMENCFDYHIKIAKQKAKLSWDFSDESIAMSTNLLKYKYYDTDNSKIFFIFDLTSGGFPIYKNYIEDNSKKYIKVASIGVSGDCSSIDLQTIALAGFIRQYPYPNAFLRGEGFLEKK